MERYRVLIARDAEKEFLSIPFPLRRQLNQQVHTLKTDPRSDQAVPIAESDSYRLEKYGWRILYEIDEEARTVTVLSFAPAEG